MKANQLTYSTLVFLGGASYGGMAAAVKLAYAAGFDWRETITSQALFGVFFFAVAFLIFLALGKKPETLTPKRIAALMALGMNTCVTGSLYNYSLSMLPVSVAIVLLFQFTWMGVVLQIILTRRRPQRAELVAAVIIAGGTLFAGGVFSESIGYLDPLGIACGLLSAASCTSFMYFSSRIENDLQPIQRGLVVCLGALTLGLVLCPQYFTSGVLQMGIWKYGLALGLFALFIPVILFGIGTPHLPTGLSTIMASAELPCGIIISVLLAGEAIDPLQSLGIIAILAGVVVSQLPYLLSVKKNSAEL